MPLRRSGDDFEEQADAAVAADDFEEPADATAISDDFEEQADAAIATDAAVAASLSASSLVVIATSVASSSEVARETQTELYWDMKVADTQWRRDVVREQGWRQGGCILRGGGK